MCHLEEQLEAISERLVISIDQHVERTGNVRPEAPPQ